ncbi:MAG: Cys-tRNA(Pro) deacylase [Clostridia bacterium]|nr:Cys-tRNA(Pro) deacylase [Clostridia bacterium]
MEEKTNVMRILDQKKIAYVPHTFAADGAKSGLEIAALFGLDPAKVFKTLVTVGKSGAHYCFVIPAENELDLKKAAAAVKEKSVAMIKSKELLPLTGYVHGGCSPIGMKKALPTVFHETAPGFDAILFSAGKIGFHVELSYESLQKVIRTRTADLVVD